MNQRPFISTQLNIFDDNRCVFSSASIGGQPVMISQEQNRKICDSTTTAIASNQSRLNPSYCSGPPPVMYPNQPQIWSCPLQAQRQGVPGGMIFNFSQPSYSCPPSCIPSVYSPPQPPAPQLMDIACKTPQSICVDYGKYGMEAMAFQQKCRQQCQTFTYDKQVGTSDQTIFTKSNVCCCGIQAVTLNAEQKEELFHRIDETQTKSKLKDTSYEVINKKRCICFPKPDPNKFGSAKTLVIGERKEKNCKDYDIVEKATREADAEAYLCCDCLDKWKKQNENTKPSCLKKKPDSSAQNQNEPKDVSISLKGNALEIIEEKQTQPKSDETSTTNNKYNVQKIALKDTPSRVKRKAKPIKDSFQRLIGVIEGRKKRINALHEYFDYTVKDLVSHLDGDIALYGKLLKHENDENLRKLKENSASNQSPNSKKFTVLDLPQSTINETFREVFNISPNDCDSSEENSEFDDGKRTYEEKFDQILSLDSKKVYRKDSRNNKTFERKPNETKHLTIMKPEAKILESNNIKPQPENEITYSFSKNELQEQFTICDPKTEITDSSLPYEKEIESTKTSEHVKIDEEIEAGNEKSSDKQPSTNSSVPFLKEEGHSSVINSDSIATERVENNPFQLSSEFGKTTTSAGDSTEKKDSSGYLKIKDQSVSEGQIKEGTNEEDDTSRSRKGPKNDISEEPKASTSSQPSTENISLVHSASPDRRKDEQKIEMGHDKVNQTGNQSALSLHTTKDEIDNEKSGKCTSDRDEDHKCCNCDVKDDKNDNERTELAVKQCTCSSNPLSTFGEVISNFYANTLVRAGNFLSYITNRRSCQQPFYENPRIITNRYGCYADCYDRRINKYFSNSDRPSCCCRMSTNKFCGKTFYDYDRNIWYSCCKGFSDEQKEVKITLRETSDRRTIRLENNCRNTRYHVIYE